MTVYESMTNAYLGCMGRETWENLLLTEEYLDWLDETGQDVDQFDQADEAAEVEVDVAPVTYRSELPCLSPVGYSTYARRCGDCVNCREVSNQDSVPKEDT